MATTSLTSELEAVNTILSAIDEAPVSSLALAGLFPLTRAKDALNEATRSVQSVGWAFNTEEGYTLSPDVSMKVTLPGDTLRFIPDKGQKEQAIARGLTLYNLTTRSATFSGPITGTRVVLLDWDSLPQAARHYITIRAARTLQGRTPVSDSTYRYTQEDEQQASLALAVEEDETRTANMLTDSWSVASVLLNH